jgi:hypothetical protein
MNKADKGILALPGGDMVAEPSVPIELEFVENGCADIGIC